MQMWWTGHGRKLENIYLSLEIEKRWRTGHSRRVETICPSLETEESWWAEHGVVNKEGLSFIGKIWKAGGLDTVEKERTFSWHLKELRKEG